MAVICRGPGQRVPVNIRQVKVTPGSTINALLKYIRTLPLRITTDINIPSGLYHIILNEGCRVVVIHIAKLNGQQIQRRTNERSLSGNRRTPTHKLINVRANFCNILEKLVWTLESHNRVRFHFVVQGTAHTNVHDPILRCDCTTGELNVC